MRYLIDKISSFFTRKPTFSKGERDPVRYEKEKELANSKDIKARVSLASNSKTHQEILYYLAERDSSDEVKKALAKNEATPVQASPILAGSDNEEVRTALAERLVALLPELNQERHSQLYAFAVQALGTLALDEVLKIRKALSSVLKDYSDAPPNVVNALAQDIEREVSEPILRFCTAVSDDVLLEILKAHPATWAVEAIAGRKTISELISQAIIDTGNKAGGSKLIKNKSAKISEATLEDIIQRAQEYPEWQSHLAGRANLPPKMLKSLAKFADRSVHKILVERSDLDKETIAEITEVFSRRLDFADESESLTTVSPQQRVKKMAKEGRLNEDTITDALGMRDREFIIAALAYLASTDEKTVNKIFDMQAAKPIVALAWHSKLSMRCALALQKDVGHVQPKELLYPRDGTDYPLTRDELIWQLDFLGIKAA